MSAVSMAQSFLIRFAETLRDWIISELQSPQMEGDVASLCDPNFDPGMDLRDEQWMNGSPPGYRYLLLLKKAARYYKLSDQPLPEESENLLNRYGYTGKT